MVRRLIHRLQLATAQLPEDIWVRCAETLLGLFFVGAALYKIESYYIIGDQSLKSHFDYWISMNLPPQWYRALVRTVFALPFGERLLEFTVIGLQGVAGAMIIAHMGKRTAGWMLLFVQLNIFLGTLGNTGFNQFVGISLWAALFFVLQGRDGTWKRKRWQALTLGLFLLQLLMAWNRLGAGDPWMHAVAWQRESLLRETVSSAYWWKAMVLGISDSFVGGVLWAGWWWALLGATIILLTPWRLYAGALLLLLMVCETLTWTNAVTSHGVMSVLVLYLWSAQEAVLVFKKNSRKTRPRTGVQGR